MRHDSDFGENDGSMHRALLLERGGDPEVRTHCRIFLCIWWSDRMQTSSRRLDRNCMEVKNFKALCRMWKRRGPSASRLLVAMERSRSAD